MTLTEQERAERRAFLERRQAGIGGSDLPVILGLVPRRNAIDVFHSKTRPIRDEDVEGGSIHLLRGNTFEPIILDHYWRKTGRKGRRAGGPVSHPDFPNVVVSPDFEIFADDGREEAYRGTGVGEIKAPSSPVFRRVYENGLRDSELIQLQVNIAAARRSWGSFAYGNFEDENGPVIEIDQPADEAMGAFLLEVGQRFWDECVEPRISPDPDEWQLLAREDAPKIVEVSGEIEMLPTDDAFARTVEEMLDAKDLAKEAEESYRALQATVYDELLDRKIGKARIPGLARLTVVTKKGYQGFDKNRLRDHRPLDRDEVERYLAKIFGDGTEPVHFGPAERGRMLFETELDLDRFRYEGDPSQYLLPGRTAEE